MLQTARRERGVGTAHITFASFSAPGDRGLLSWRRTAAGARAAHGLAPITDVNALSYWRLHAPNYRELARSAPLFDTVGEARAHASEVSARTQECTVHTFIAEAVRSVGWYLAVDGEPVVMCARWYQSLVVAAQSGGRARLALPSATPVDIPVARR